MFRQSQYHSNRGGLLGKLSSTFDLGDVKNQLEVGGWYKNTSKLMDNTLSINYGAKYLHVDADFKNNGNTPVNGKLAPIFADPTRPSLSAPTKSGFLPQVGAIYRVSDADELFANFSQNVNQFP